MEQQRKSSQPISLANFDAALSISTQNKEGMDHKDVTTILQATARHLSKTAPSSKVNDLIHNSNDEAVLQQLEEVLKTHFHPLNLTTLPSVVIYLLLNYFLLRRENREVEAAKKLYEDHIALLKEKNAELEEKVKEGAGCKESPTSCKSCDEVREREESLLAQYAKLKQSYDELCHINDQWALDYETLAKYISNATGFHSVTTTSSNSSQHMNSASKFMPDPSCVRCGIYESQLDDKQQEIDDLRAMIVGLREDVKECKEMLSQKQRELSNMENEYQIARLQIQEIGDLQQTLNMKQDYRKMQRSLQHKTKQYQDAMCEKLELQKQVEKLRQTFLKFFPTPNPAPQPHLNNQSMPPSRLPHSGGYYSFPMHSCRHNIQSRPADPTPPTPPGLLARGDLRGGYVEKDEHPLPAIRLEEHSTNTAINRYPSAHLVHRGHTPRGNNVAVPGMKMPRSHSSDRVSAHHSTDHATHSRFSDPTSYSHSKFSTTITTPSPNSTTSYTNTSIPSTLSSLGYVSEDPNNAGPSALVRSAPNLMQNYSPRSKGNFGSEEAEFNGSSYGSMRPRMQKSLSQESAEIALGQGSTARPTSLILPQYSGIAPLQAEQCFTCTNCKMTFACSSDTFEPWFEHIKVCSAQNA